MRRATLGLANRWPAAAATRREATPRLPILTMSAAATIIAVVTGDDGR